MDSKMNGKKQSLSCELIENFSLSREIFMLEFIWPGPVPMAGQFFMIRPKRSAVFLGRPLSMENWKPAETDKDYIRKKVRGKKNPYMRYLTRKHLESNIVSFLIARRGTGTEELSGLQIGEEAELTGPLGNAWSDFSMNDGAVKPIALLGGGLGIAPLNALLLEREEGRFEVYAGFKTGFKTEYEKILLAGPSLLYSDKLTIATEDGKNGNKGQITDFFEPEKYSLVCACGPELMLKAVTKKCMSAGVPCLICIERRMACGVGACLGCTVKTVQGNLRCCADGPIFKAEEVIFED